MKQPIIYSPEQQVMKDQPVHKRLIRLDVLERWYEKEFNVVGSDIRADRSWKNMKKGDQYNRQRFEYNISWLYGNVLDVGAADGYGAYVMRKSSKIQTITCLEIQDKALQQAEQNLKGLPGIVIMKGIGENIPFAADSFDSVYCGCTLEHVFDDERVVKEVKRVTKDLVVFNVPIQGKLNRQHVRRYESVDAFVGLIKKYFDVIHIHERQREKHKGTGRMNITVVAKKQKAKE